MTDQPEKTKPGDTITMARSEFDRMQRRLIDYEVEREKILMALLDLCLFNPDDRPQHFNQDNAYYTPGDEDSPWLTESFLYPLLGKEDARTVRTLVRRIGEATIGDAWDNRYNEHWLAYYLCDVEIVFDTIEARAAFRQRLGSDRSLIPEGSNTRGRFPKDNSTCLLLRVDSNLLRQLHALHKSGDIPKPTVVKTHWRDYLSRRADERYEREMAEKQAQA